MLRWLVALAALVAAPVDAGTCRDQDYAGNSYRICEADMTRDDLRVFLARDNGVVYGHFTPVNDMLEAQGKTLGFAMNAGMYHDDRSPVGLYIEDGQEVHRLITSEGPGNFGLLPNGVFCIGQKRADVIETRAFARNTPDCRFATQSGPMLVIDGKLHPRFLKDSTSRYIRNGVGVSDDGKRVVFAISRNAVTFHEFGSLFKDALKTPNALYFDGNISRLYAPEIGSYGPGWRMGPIVGLVEPLE